MFYVNTKIIYLCMVFQKNKRRKNPLYIIRFAGNI